MDPRAPVVVGVGQTSQREPADTAKPPIELLEAAARARPRPTPARRCSRRADIVAVVQIVSWRYPDPGALLARRLGIDAAPHRGHDGRWQQPAAARQRVRRTHPARRVRRRAHRRRREHVHPLARPPRTPRRAPLGDGRRRALLVGDRRRPTGNERRGDAPRCGRADARVPAVRDRAAGRGRAQHRRAPAARRRALVHVRRGRRRQPVRVDAHRVLPRPTSAPCPPTTAWWCSRTRSGCARTSTSTRAPRSCCARTRPHAPPASPTIAWCTCTRVPRRTTTGSSPNATR